MIKNKVVIGILPTYNLTNEDNDPYQDRATFVRMYEELIKENGAIPIGLLNNNIDIYKDICDGYVWPGGNCIQKDFYKIFDDVINNHKPLLGICLGLQAISTYFNILEDQKKDNKLSIEETYEKNKEINPYLIKATEESIKLHSHYVTKDEESINNAKHKIYIKDNTFLSEIYNKKEILVPSMHTFITSRIAKNLIVSALSKDNVVEGLEYHKNNSYILGVQYHPELIKDNKIFEWLIEKSTSKYRILINKENKIPNDLNFNIITYNSKYPNIDKRESLLEESTYYAFLELKNKMLELGYEMDLESGYRYTEDQKELFDNISKEKGLEHASRYVAKPRHSEHESGLAVDICAIINGIWRNEHNEELNDFYKIFHNIIAEYGFILRYPKGKENITGYGYEPWHLRYIANKKIAHYIMDNNLTLEEYTSNMKK